MDGVIVSYRSADSHKEDISSNIPQKTLSTNHLDHALKSSHSFTLSQRQGRIHERVANVSDLPVEFRSNFAERNGLKFHHQSNLTQDSKLVDVDRLNTFQSFHTANSS